jgi:FkbM family methyltransferase
MGVWESHGGRADWDGSKPLLLFEPQEEAFKQLAKNLGGKENIRMERVALGAKPGVATLHTADPSHSSTLLKPKETLRLYPEITFAGTERVRMDTLDHVIAALGAEGVYSEMVIDVQGYELEVLKGATETLRRDIDWIMCEVSLTPLWEGGALMGQIDAFLEEHDFVRNQYETYLYGPDQSCGDAVYNRT